MTKSYRDLEVWKKSIEIYKLVYTLTDKLPYGNIGLTDQMRRSAASIASNIAEGQGRKTPRDFVHFLHIAKGSLNELNTQLDMYKISDFGRDALLQKVCELTFAVEKMLNRLIKVISDKIV